MKFFPLILIVVVVACSPGVERMDAPDDLIQHDKMVKLMTELMKLEGHVTSKYVQLVRYHKVISNSGDSLVKAHGFTPAQFKRSMEYYTHEQNELEKMYGEILDNLNREMVEIELKEAEVAKSDSTVINTGSIKITPRN